VGKLAAAPVKLDGAQGVVVMRVDVAVYVEEAVGVQVGKLAAAPVKLAGAHGVVVMRVAVAV